MTLLNINTGYLYVARISPVGKHKHNQNDTSGHTNLSRLRLCVSYDSAFERMQHQPNVGSSSAITRQAALHAF